MNVSTKVAKKHITSSVTRRASSTVTSDDIKPHNCVMEDESMLQNKLTEGNYKSKFHQLLCREEKEHKTALHERYKDELICIN